MAKYHASPFGNFVGKLGDTVGAKWKNKYYVRKRVEPKQPGTLEMYELYKKGLVTRESFSFKQMNIRRAVLQVIGCIGRKNLTNMIDPIWTKLCTERSLAMTGINLFTKANLSRLWASMKHQNKEHNAKTNTPDMEFFYWQDERNKEVDFVVKKGLKVRQLLQVCWDITEETKKREVNALVKAMKEFNLKNGLVITEDFEREERVDKKKIIYKPLWKWVLE